MTMTVERNLILLLIYPLLEAVSGFAPVLPSRPQQWLSTRYSSASSVDELDFALVPKGERTFYEILGASPNASKLELKQNYIKLARVTHPDALIGTNSTGGDTSTEFSEIARAWKVLSNEKDRRRYDRSLVAEDFKKNVEKVASSVVETAAPRVKKAFEDFAMPFLRRTTVTTVATVSAAVDTFGNGERLNLGSAVASGMKAAQAAGRVVDGIEFLEKCSELEER
jgi:DnaJ domain